MFNRNPKKSENYYKPIVFVNSPIDNCKRDIIGLKSIANSITAAVKNSAQLIGLISDYGGGKTSLTKILSQDRHYFSNTITINMWDSMSAAGKNPSNEEINVSTLTKSFMFQLAAGISPNTAKYVNRRLSKNFGILSFSQNSWSFWLWGLWAFLCYAIYACLKNLAPATIASAIGELWTVEEALWTNSFTLLQMLSPFFLVLFGLFLMIGLRNATIAYSSWKECKHDPDICDIFESYLHLYGKLCHQRKHCLIIVDDLDRISNKELVIDFLKEIYRLCNLAPSSKRNHPVFVISMMPEYHLDHCGNSSRSDFFYDKFFDYTVNLPPIHYEDYSELMLEIIGDKREELNKLLDDQKITTKLPDTFRWLITGHNLSIRQLKERLNAAVSLLVNLKNKGYRNNCYVSFASCAAVVYLEKQYPVLFSYLIAEEDTLSRIIRTAYLDGVDHTPEQSKNITQMLDSLFDDFHVEKSSEWEHMKADLLNMLASGDLDADFRIYFYSFPKNSYVKNNIEREIFNALTSPQTYTHVYDLDHKIDQMTELSKQLFIVVPLERYSQASRPYPGIIFENSFLFQTAVRLNSNLLQISLQEVTQQTIQDPKKFSHVVRLFPSIISQLNQQFWITYGEWMSGYFPQLSDINKLKIRSLLLSVLGEQIQYFRGLYLSDKIPENCCPAEESKCLLISPGELNSGLSPDILIPLIDVSLITQDNLSGIVHYLSHLDISSSAILNIWYSIVHIDTSHTYWYSALYFMDQNNMIDQQLFLYATAKIESRNQQATYRICNFVNKLAPDDISNLCLLKINSLCISDLSKPLIDRLASKGLFTAGLLYYAQNSQAELFPFSDPSSAPDVDKACIAIFESSYEHRQIFMKLRIKVLTQYVNGLDSERIQPFLTFLFKNNFPDATPDEQKLLRSAGLCPAL